MGNRRNKNLGKVRHYRRSFYTGPEKLKRVLGAVAVVAVMFGAGLFAAPHVLDWGTHLWYTAVRDRDLDVSSASSQAVLQPADSAAASQAESTAPEAAPTAAPQQPTAAITDGSWATVSLSALTGEEAIRTAAQSAAANGARYALIPLKDTTGYIYYASGVELASKSIAATTVDAGMIATLFKEAGITPVAYLDAFHDPVAPYTDRSLGIHYAGSDYMWLDAAADAGGKPWLNPYDTAAVNYIGDLVAEVSGLGFDHVMLGSVQFPAYVSAKQDYGTTNGLGRAGALTSAINTWKGRFGEGVTLWYEYPYAYCAVTAEEPASALGALPAALGIRNLMITMPALTEGEDAADTSALDDVVAQEKAAGCAYVAVRSGSTAEFR